MSQLYWRQGANAVYSDAPVGNLFGPPQRIGRQHPGRASGGQRKLALRRPSRLHQRQQRGGDHQRVL